MKTLYRNVCTSLIALLFILLSSLTAMAVPPDSSVAEVVLPARVAAQGAAVTVNVSPAIAATEHKAAEKPVHWEAPPPMGRLYGYWRGHMWIDYSNVAHPCSSQQSQLEFG